MKLIKERIEEINKNGYQLDFSTVFENAFENYKKIALYAGSMLLVFLVLFFMLVTAIIIALFGVEFINETIKPFLQHPEKISNEGQLIYTGFVLIISCLLSPFQAGFLKMADCGERGEEFKVANIFQYYKLPYIINIIGATLIISVVSSSFSFLPQNPTNQLISLFISITLTLLTYLTVPFIVFGKLNSIQAIKSSIIIVSQKPLLVLGLLIVAGLGAITGIIGFCLGVFFTIPFTYSMNYSIYKAILGIDSENDDL